jgi:hypothetical protein
MGAVYPFEKISVVEKLGAPLKWSLYPIVIPARELSLPVMNHLFKHIEAESPDRRTRDAILENGIALLKLTC